MPRVSGSGCPRDSFNLLWDGLPGERQSRETGVGKYEHSPADMRRTKIASRELNSGAVEESARQISRDLGFPRTVARGLLHDTPFCAGVEPDAEHVGPQTFTGSFSSDGRSNARVLAGRTTDDDMGRSAFKSSDVVMQRHTREPVCKKPPALLIDFDELDCSEAACLVQADSVAADVAEKVEDIHCSIHWLSGVTGARRGRLRLGWLQRPTTRAT